ncbi:unnamed protein product [Blumeria hordei]|uniref:pH-response regulator protein palC n=1 Tax=Blumeria hordei TaxID=2867405 RepID=A0A383UVI8_BLUHO|nr:unnamed protein product [Blumeria hordei]
MPFQFSLPTTSSFSFSQYFGSDSHPSLPLAASTYRAVLRDTLKKHKRLPPAEQSAHLSSVLTGLENYIPYLLAVDHGLSNGSVAGQPLDIVLKSTPCLEWRPTISNKPLSGREVARLNLKSLEYEIYFVLSTLAYTHTLFSRAALYPLYSTSTSSLDHQQRMLAITTATKHLLTAGSIHEYLSTRSEKLPMPAPCIDISQASFKALASLALAEATLLAVFKDDPYPSVVSQDRNKSDKEWMIKSTEIPKVRAHLFARLCLAAAEHAANGLSLLNSVSSNGQGKVNPELLNYMDKLIKSSRAKSCRFLGIDAEISGQLGIAIAWLQAGLHQLGHTPEDQLGKGIGRIKRDWDGKREDRRMEKDTQWGADAGKIDERRVLDMLEKKWTKTNDTINVQKIPAIGPLISSMPSGREIHSIKLYCPPKIETSELVALKAVPSHDGFEAPESPDEQDGHTVDGAPLGINADYSGRGSYF